MGSSDQGVRRVLGLNNFFLAQSGPGGSYSRVSQVALGNGLEQSGFSDIGEADLTGGSMELASQQKKK